MNVPKRLLSPSGEDNGIETFNSYDYVHQENGITDPTVKLFSANVINAIGRDELFYVLASDCGDAENKILEVFKKAKEMGDDIDIPVVSKINYLTSQLTSSSVGINTQRNDDGSHKVMPFLYHEYRRLIF